ncbi:hypothetical protein ACQW5G_00470 [Fructilactobacillus sp. Tb1]
MTEIRPLMVPNDDGTNNEHQVYLITSVDAIPGLTERLDRIEAAISKLQN